MELNIDALQMLPVDDPRADQPIGLQGCEGTCVFTANTGNNTLQSSCGCTYVCTEAGCASVYGNCSHVGTCIC
ncbi:ALQxL family class IV lanthipeptide [Streptomyces sp. NBC_00289]|uniref:ALQxL family class IV lanthipeptide n=1 Tax=Streptomyces sp. NBC_00289 TaxID=2975703 RepID=UPI00352DDA57